jgi:hypothetical protein
MKLTDLPTARRRLRSAIHCGYPSLRRPELDSILHCAGLIWPTKPMPRPFGSEAKRSKSSTTKAIR